MIENHPVFVLDSFAVLAHFQDEPGGEKVLELFTRAVQGEVLLAMSLVNVGEIAYFVSCEGGKKKVQQLLDDLRGFPVRFYDATEERIFAVAWLKADFPISYADAFAASLAQELKATLVTGDPEFKRLKNNLTLLWLE